MRGSSALLAAADTAIQCRRTRDGMTASVVKQKNSSDGQRMHFALEAELDSAVLAESAASQSIDADGFRPTVLMERVSKFLETATEDVSLRTIRGRDGVTGKSEYIAVAVERLADEGFVAKTAGPRGALYRSLAPFREGDYATE